MERSLAYYVVQSAFFAAPGSNSSLRNEKKAAF
ncbi:MAG: hypothetical protein ACI932_001764, partial [Paracoccaceae bacterium]